LMEVGKLIQKNLGWKEMMALLILPLIYYG
jgi:hypothetical protein